MSEEYTIEIAGQKFEVVKKGADQAAQVLAIGRFVSKYGRSVTALAGPDGKVGFDDVFELIEKLMTVLTPEALIELFATVLGCTIDFANENFDIAVLIDAVLMVWDHQPSFRKVVSRFFSTNTSADVSADSSTPSAPLTDGPTI